MSAPRWMMENEYEPEGYEYEDYDNENEKFYTEYGDGVCTICMGGSFVRKIYIENYWEDEEEDYDY
jgi:hypothetical protein